MTTTAARRNGSTPEPAAAPEPPGLGELLKHSLERLAAAATARLVDVAVDKVDDLADRLEQVKRDGGVGLNAAFGAGTAYMAGKNPVWGAIKGGWSALGTGAKVGIIAGLVLLGLLSPVALVVALVGLLVWAIVHAARTTG